MTKNLQTKNRILELLKKRKMTVTEISEDLGISKSTASQHVSELVRMKLIEQEYNPHFKKVKYYKALGLSSNAINYRYDGVVGKIVGISVVALLGAILIAMALIGFGSHYHNTANATTNVSNALGGALACPVLLIYNNPNTSIIYSIVNAVASGYPCQMTYIDINTSSFTEALGSLKYISENGTVYIPSDGFNYTLSNIQIANLETAVNEGHCYDLKALQFFGIRFSVEKGITCKANIYS